jgi:hypothetical protein
MTLDLGSRRENYLHQQQQKFSHFSFVNTVGSGIRERELPGKLHQQQQKYAPSLLLMLLDLGSGRENYLVSFINNNKNVPLLFC